MYIDNFIKKIVKIINEGIKYQDLLNYIRNKSGSAINNQNDCQFLVDFHRINIVVNGNDINKENLSDINDHTEMNSIKGSDKARKKALDIMNSRVFEELEVKPNKVIMNELITNCHQYGYDSCSSLVIAECFSAADSIMLTCSDEGSRRIYFNCQKQDYLQVRHEVFFGLKNSNPEECDEKIIIYPKIQGVLEFDLEVNEREQIVYKNIKLSYKIPRFFNVIDTSSFIDKTKMKLIEYLSRIPMVWYRYYDMKIYAQESAILLQDNKHENKGIFSIIVKKVLQFVNRIFSSKSSEKNAGVDNISVSSDSAFSDNSNIDDSCSGLEEQIVDERSNDKDEQNTSRKTSADSAFSDFHSDYDKDDIENTQITEDSISQIAPSSKLNNSRTTNMIACSSHRFI